MTTCAICTKQVHLQPSCSSVLRSDSNNIEGNNASAQIICSICKSARNKKSLEKNGSRSSKCINIWRSTSQASTSQVNMPSAIASTSIRRSVGRGLQQPTSGSKNISSRQT